MRLIEHLPPGSAYFREADHPAAWTVQDHLIADLVDDQRTLLWFKTDDGVKKRNRPTPVPRPGVIRETDTQVRQFGNAAEGIDEIEAWLKGITESQQTDT